MFTKVGLRARPTRAIGQRGQTLAVIGRARGLAETGWGQKVTCMMAATPLLRDRLSFLHRVSAGGPTLLRAASSGSPRAAAIRLPDPSRAGPSRALRPAPAPATLRPLLPRPLVSVGCAHSLA